jgi:hypothetical protein
MKVLVELNLEDSPRVFNHHGEALISFEMDIYIQIQAQHIRCYSVFSIVCSYDPILNRVLVNEINPNLASIDFIIEFETQ